MKKYIIFYKIKLNQPSFYFIHFFKIFTFTFEILNLLNSAPCLILNGRFFLVINRCFLLPFYVHLVTYYAQSLSTRFAYLNLCHSFQRANFFLSKFHLRIIFVNCVSIHSYSFLDVTFSRKCAWQFFHRGHKMFI